MRGHRVERRFGWDTHGLPIEMEVQHELNLSGPREIREYGVARFNEACKAKVQANTEPWQYITKRLGRWIDFENDYKTMDVEFMESVWWVFRSLWDRGLVYEDFKVVPYSWGAGTVLSNFEVNLGGYRDIEDPSLTVRLRVLEDNGPVVAGDWLLIWTTTPWTLPGNLAVAVNENVTYVRIKRGADYYWSAETRAHTLWEDEPHEIVATASGHSLLGSLYEPPYPYFSNERAKGAFRVVSSKSVTTDEGTGLVHMAPAYGEADFLALQDAGINVLVDPVDLDARFTDEAFDVAGMHIKDATEVLIELLRDTEKLVHSTTIVHSYPFCWRTDTPLIYKAIPTWYVRVESFREQMTDLNQRIRWVPDYVGERRFGNWLSDARDWAVSRNRFWGSCIPIWVCESCSEKVCIGSRQELQQRSGVWLDDLHKHIVDDVTFPCSACEATMTRVPEVLDVWFESGSMPYGKMHYPFKNRERFAMIFPADFIAEGLDQTRGWFYTLVVLAAALFEDIPFKNCVVNGMILAEDGVKMSKHLKNYPDPEEVLDGPGADALRIYLINSPVLRAEPLRFSLDGVRDVVRTTLLPLWNAVSFFTTYAEADNITLDEIRTAPHLKDRPELDRWIVSVLQSLIRQVDTEMARYRLYAVIPPIVDFIEDLTNWYIRRSRRRFWRERGSDNSDKLSAFATLYDVLVTFSRTAAPVIPFITEEIYQRLVRAPSVADTVESVHFTNYPEVNEALIDHKLEESMAAVRQVVNLARGLRKQNALPVRQPLAKLTVVTRDGQVVAAIQSHTALIASELNVRSVVVEEEDSHLVRLSAKANFKELGPRLGKTTKKVAANIAQLADNEISDLLTSGKSIVGGVPITANDIVIDRIPRVGVVVATDRLVSVALDTTLSADLIAEGLARNVISKLQGIRRELNLDVTDRINLSWWTNDTELTAAIEANQSLIAGEVLASQVVHAPGPLDMNLDLDGRRLHVEVVRA